MLGTLQEDCNGGQLRRQGKRKRARRCLLMLAELERIRLDAAEVRNNRFDTERTLPQFARAFREYGIDVETLSQEEVVALLQGSAIREHLVVGLDIWALVPRNVGDEQTQPVKLLAIARQAGSHPWMENNGSM